MKYFYFFFFFQIFATSLSAQIVKTSGKGKIVGSITDAVTKQPVDFATNTVYNQGNKTPQPLKSSQIWQIDAGAHLLRTTHKTYFKGVNVGLNYLLTNSVSIGVGLEYSSLDFHNDNGWELRNLHFLPAYVEANVLLKKFRKANFYLRPATGVTMMRYAKVNQDHSDNPHTINEQGLYLNLASGIAFNLNKRIQPLVEVGIKGFKNSLNDLDVNPHGLTLRLGFLIN